MAVDWSNILAGYAAGVASIVGIRQIVTDRASVLVDFNADVIVFTLGVKGSEQKHYQLTVTNAGRRPVTIVQAGFLGAGVGLLLPSDWINQIPFTLGEGEYRNLLQPRDYPNIADYPIPTRPVPVVRDSVGRWWPRRRRSRMLWRSAKAWSERRRAET
ncbi:MAG: hypothetical protein WAT66_00640 [Actinomycetota bacterium]